MKVGIDDPVSSCRGRMLGDRNGRVVVRPPAAVFATALPALRLEGLVQNPPRGKSDVLFAGLNEPRGALIGLFNELFCQGMTG